MSEEIEMNRWYDLNDKYDVITQVMGIRLGVLVRTMLIANGEYQAISTEYIPGAKLIRNSITLDIEIW